MREAIKGDRTSSGEIFSYEGGNQGRSHLLRRDLLVLAPQVQLKDKRGWERGEGGDQVQSTATQTPSDASHLLLLERRVRCARMREAIKGDRTSSSSKGESPVLGLVSRYNPARLARGKAST